MSIVGPWDNHEYVHGVSIAGLYKVCILRK